MFLVVIAAYILINSAYLPQISLLLKNKSSENVSIPFLVMLATALGLFEIYFIYIKDIMLIVGNSMGLLLEIVVLYLAIIYRRKF